MLLNLGTRSNGLFNPCASVPKRPHSARSSAAGTADPAFTRRVTPATHVGRAVLSSADMEPELSLSEIIARRREPALRDCWPEKVCRLYWPKFYRCARAHLSSTGRDEGHAEDVAQSSLIKLVTKINDSGLDLDERDEAAAKRYNPDGYAYEICMNVVNDLLRKFKGRREEQLPLPTPDAERAWDIYEDPNGKRAFANKPIGRGQALDGTIEAPVERGKLRKLLARNLKGLERVERHVLRGVENGRTLEEIFDYLPVQKEWQKDPDAKEPTSGDKSNFVYTLKERAYRKMRGMLANDRFGHCLVYPFHVTFKVKKKSERPPNPEYLELLSYPGEVCKLQFVTPLPHWLLVRPPQKGRTGRESIRVSVDQLRLEHLPTSARFKVLGSSGREQVITVFVELPKTKESRQ